MTTLTYNQLLAEIISTLGLEACQESYCYISEEHDDCHNYGSIMNAEDQEIAFFDFQYEAGCSVNFYSAFGGFSAKVESYDILLDALSADFLKEYDRLISENFFQNYLDKKLEELEKEMEFDLILTEGEEIPF